jgi:sterol desaturase/sphingolipid hydroxylase (fatty acid hydroxylase superfamily)
MNYLNKEKKEIIIKRRKKEEKKKKRKEEKKKNKKEYDNQLNILFKSIFNNYIFYFVLFFCLYKFKQNLNYDSGYIKLIFSFFIMSIYGYFIHYFSHHVNFMNYYKQSNNIFTNNNYTGPIIKSFFKFLDFHDKIHHDTNINKDIDNIIYEFLNNIILQGLIIFILVNFFKIIDTRVIILWTFMYSTVHNFNYLFIKPTTHSDHHLNNHTNYGIDYCDILFNSKYDLNDIETHNHAGINLLIITYIINLFT